MASGGEQRLGTIYTAGAFSLWGLLPLYWRLLEHVPAFEILAHRIVWTAVFTSLVLLVGRRYRIGAFVRDRRLRRGLVLTGALLGVNWFTYIYAVNAGRVLDASMGYYINPLVSVLLGTLVLGERLSLLQKTAVSLAAIGVLVITIHYAVVPWVALVLAGTFGYYGLRKKQMGLDPLTALAVETTFLAPAGVALIAVLGAGGAGALAAVDLTTDMLLVAAGVATALPLYWFAHGARRIPLSRVGFLQYIAPTLMLLIGVFLFGEPFTGAEAVSFGLIWLALAIYTASHTPVAKEIENRIERRIRMRRQNRSEERAAG